MPISLEGVPGSRSYDRLRESRTRICPLKGGVDIVHTYVCFIGAE